MNRPTGNPRSTIHNPQSGFTLVELLVVITIIAILAGVMMGALQAARQTARTAKTKATIAKLNSIVLQRYESYHTRRMPPFNATTRNPKEFASQRLPAFRELIRMEMPDRWSDVALLGDPTKQEIPFNLEAAPLLSLRFFRAYGSAYTRVTGAPLNLSHDDAIARLKRWQSAECLYLIVMSTPDAADKFNENEIGDADGDGLREFHDGWGNPIQFLRWAPAFNDSDIQAKTWDDSGAVLVARQKAATDDPDPFDPMKIDGGWRLVPLIFSAGRDGIYDIEMKENRRYIGSPYWDYYAGVSPMPPLDIGWPVDRDNVSVTALGAKNDSLDHFDNIHNHRIEAK